MKSPLSARTPLFNYRAYPIRGCSYWDVLLPTKIISPALPVDGEPCGIAMLRIVICNPPRPRLSKLLAKSNTWMPLGAPPEGWAIHRCPSWPLSGPLTGSSALGKAPAQFLYFSQTSADSGTSCLGRSVMAPSGHAALHTPHPKHLVGSI